MSTKHPSRVVFVGNIPYGLSEEQITDIFNSAGKVLNFRLVYDRETVRNLNDYEVMNRKLRVDYSTEGRVDQEDDKMGSTGNGTAISAGGANRYGDQYTNGSTANTTAAPAPASQLPPLPPGKEIPAGVSVSDAISRTLNTLPPAQLLDILTHMKSLASTDPGRATELLNQAPQLSYAIFQALLLMGLVQPEAIHSVIDPSAVQPAPAPPTAYGVPASAAYPGAATATPPVSAPYAPPAAQPRYAPPPAAATSAPAATEQQEPDHLMKMVLDLPQEMIDQLPDGERQQIMALRAQFSGQR